MCDGGEEGGGGGVGLPGEQTIAEGPNFSLLSLCHALRQQEHNVAKTSLSGISIQYLLCSFLHCNMTVFLCNTSIECCLNCEL